MASAERGGGPWTIALALRSAESLLLLSKGGTFIVEASMDRAVREGPNGGSAWEAAMRRVDVEIGIAVQPVLADSREQCVAFTASVPPGTPFAE